MITKLEFTDGGYRYLTVEVDCFAKWVQILLLRTKSSKKVGDWLHIYFLLRFGKPHWVHVDASKEFEGLFA